MLKQNSRLQFKFGRFKHSSTETGNLALTFSVPNKGINIQSTKSTTNTILVLGVLEN